MLRRFVASESETWDKYLPYLLFAYREVPQESSGFSPFELLYGRWVRGPLAIVREAWTNVKLQEQNVASQVIEMRTRLLQMTDLVHNNMAKAQAKQKAWFDKAARCRQFEVGDMVLVLLPSSSSKLQVQWQGPFCGTKRVS